MESLVVQFQAHTAPNDWAGVVSHFRQKRKDLATVSVNDVSRALAMLNARSHSVGYGCILSLGVADGEKFKANFDLVQQACVWMLECEPVALASIPVEAAAVCRATAASAERDQGASLRVLRPLATMVMKCQPSNEHMTPAHAAALKAALCAKKYYIGQRIIATPLYVLNSADTGLTSTDFLLYCYYGGLVSIGCKDYAKASELLLLAVTSPTAVPDAIIVIAWQKYLLVHAIHTGEVAEHPRHTPHATAKHLKDNPAILQFVRAYCAGNVTQMRSILEQDTALLRDAGAVGLAYQLLDKVVTRSIQRLTSTYVTLSLADIAELAKLELAEHAESHILKIIDSGEMRASIDDEAHMVRFLEPEEDATPKLLASLNQKVGEMIEMQQRLQAASREVALEPGFVMHAVQVEKSPGKGHTGGSLFAASAGPALALGDSD